MTPTWAGSTFSFAKRIFPVAGSRVCRVSSISAAVAMVAGQRAAIRRADIFDGCFMRSIVIETQARFEIFDFDSRAVTGKNGEGQRKNDSSETCPGYSLTN